MSTEHTIGPWNIRDDDEDGVVSIVGSSQIVIARVRTATVEPGDGNARLIAAAPELLAVLERVQSMFSYQFEGGLTGCMADLSIDVRAAIAKATGEQQ